MTDVTTTAVTLVESWNCRNFRAASFTQQPHKIALTIEVTLSSIRMTSEAFATSVPAMPIETPTCAVLSAGPSSVPSPVVQTATIFPKGTQLFNENLLIFGRRTGKNLSGYLYIIQLPKDWSFHNNAAHCKDLTLGSDRVGSKDIITGAHFDGSACQCRTPWRIRGSSMPTIPMRVSSRARSSYGI